MVEGPVIRTFNPESRRARALEWIGSGRGRRGRGSGEASPPAAPSLLSSEHISPLGVESGCAVSVSEGGRVGVVKIPGSPPPFSGRRGRIRGFTKRSGRALMLSINSIDQRKCQAEDFAFVTLTYTREFPAASATKRDFDNFIKRLERAWGPMGGWWKLEPQERGAPHYHLLLYCPGVDKTALCLWVAQNWYEMVGRGDKNHLLFHMGALGNRPCVEVVKDWRGVAAYVPKYMGKSSKGDEEWQHPGRYWGCRRKELIPISVVTRDVPQRVASILRRALIRYYESQHSGWYYWPGHGSTPGRKLHKDSLFSGFDGQTVRFSKVVDRLNQMGAGIRPLRRRWLGRRGGWRGFVPAAVFERLLMWSFERCGISPGWSCAIPGPN